MASCLLSWQGFHLLIEHYKMGKLQECKATIVASGSRLLAVRAALEAHTSMTFRFSGYAMGLLVLFHAMRIA